MVSICKSFLAYLTDGRASATVSVCLSVVCNVCIVAYRKTA